MWRREMQREGFDLPLLIGGATTSRVHTAVKISPNYTRSQAIYVTDASRAVGVVSGLMSAEERPKAIARVREEYERMAASHARGQAEKARASIAQARANRLRIDWTGYAPPKPTFLGTRAFAELRPRRACPLYRLDAVLPGLGAEGRLSRAFSTIRKYGEAARHLFEDAQAMLQQLIAEKWLKANAVVGFWPANSVGDDIELYTDDTRTKTLATLHTLRQQMTRDPGRAKSRACRFRRAEGERRRRLCRRLRRHGRHRRGGCGARFERANDDYSKIMVKALADRLAEAFAEALHEKVRKELWAYAPDEKLSNDELIAETYRGIRPAPGYPAQPDHTEKRTLFTPARRRESDGAASSPKFCAMWPAAAVSGLYFSHPEARLFRPRQDRPRSGPGLCRPQGLEPARGRALARAESQLRPEAGSPRDPKRIADAAE